MLSESRSEGCRQVLAGIFFENAISRLGCQVYCPFSRETRVDGRRVILIFVLIDVRFVVCSAVRGEMDCKQCSTARSITMLDFQLIKLCPISNSRRLLQAPLENKAVQNEYGFDTKLCSQ